MKYPRNAKIFRGQLEAAPLAGVFFLLVLFMLLHSHLVFQPGVRIQLPDDPGRPSPGVAGPKAVVSMDTSGQLFYENQTIQERELAVRLQEAAQRYPDLTLIIQADKAVTMENYYSLVKLASQVGIRSLLLAARVASPEPLVP
jgi:biopolymer transport protein ExbD